jgi:hypothetical protein
LAFALDQVKAMVPKRPEWQTREPFKSLLAGDVKDWSRVNPFDE